MRQSGNNQKDKFFKFFDYTIIFAILIFLLQLNIKILEKRLISSMLVFFKDINVLMK